MPTHRWPAIPLCEHHLPLCPKQGWISKLTPPVQSEGVHYAPYKSRHTDTSALCCRSHNRPQCLSFLSRLKPPFAWVFTGPGINLNTNKMSRYLSLPLFVFISSIRLSQILSMLLFPATSTLLLFYKHAAVKFLLPCLPTLCLKDICILLQKDMMLNLLSEQQFMHKAQEGIATKGKWPWKKNKQLSNSLWQWHGKTQVL